MFLSKERTKIEDKTEAKGRGNLTHSLGSEHWPRLIYPPKFISQTRRSSQPQVAHSHPARKIVRRIVKWMFAVPDGERSTGPIILWWELRRIPYNLIVCFVGLCSYILFLLFISIPGSLKPGEDPVEPFVVILAPFAINFFYTAGWVVELLVRNIWPERSKRIGLRLFKLGLIFSLVVVLIPSTVWGIIVLFQVLK